MKYARQLHYIHAYYMSYSTLILGVRSLSKGAITHHYTQTDIAAHLSVFTYLLTAKGKLHTATPLHRPSLQTIEAAFLHYALFLESEYGITRETARELLGTPLKSFVKQYQCVRHYLFLCTLPAWYDKLPDI